MLQDLSCSQAAPAAFPDHSPDHLRGQSVVRFAPGELDGLRHGVRGQKFLQGIQQCITHGGEEFWLDPVLHVLVGYGTNIWGEQKWSVQ